LSFFGLKDQELKEKVAKNLAKQEKDGKDEVEHFELRKDTIASPSKTETTKKSSSAVSVEKVMPRAVILSNVANIQQTVHETKPKLYDDEDEDTAKSIEDVMRTKRSPHSEDQNSNRSKTYESESELNSSSVRESHNATSSSEQMQPQSESESKTN
jgi:hypothetical protein